VGIKQVKVDVNELSLGMYVSGLDRPWSQTPFPLQGFYLRELQEVNQLKSLCNHVYIDVEKGRGPITSNLYRATKRQSASAKMPSATKLSPRLKFSAIFTVKLRPCKKKLKKPNSCIKKCTAPWLK
jgi:hypothetical protein